MSTATVRSPLVLPHDPAARFAILNPLTGTFVRLSSGDFCIEGTLVAVVRPAMFSDSPNPIVVVDMHGERIAGPVLSGDTLS